MNAETMPIAGKCSQGLPQKICIKYDTAEVIFHSTIAIHAGASKRGPSEIVSTAIVELQLREGFSQRPHQRMVAEQWSIEVELIAFAEQYVEFTQPCIDLTPNEIDPHTS